jgi:aspartyl-tRNA(Asn)/glutamyl-tRNA(Gln) amidotransferase subunit A
MSLLEKTAFEIRELVLGKEVSAEEVTRTQLARIDALDEKVKAYITVDREGALAQARKVDEKIARGASPGALAGIPLALKDNICTKGLLTTCASRILANFVPPYDAHVVEKIRAADGIILGKTNMDEFAMGSSTENSGLFPTRNPWDTERVPGGSSGGSAAAVASDLAFAALGSDTGGSIRQPASFCGVVCLKPTYGRISRYGLVAFASSLDQIGPITRDVRDAGLLMNVISGKDPADSTSVDVPVPDYLAALDAPLEKVKLGVPKEYFAEGLDGEVAASVREALAVYEKLGVKLVDISMPHTDYAVACYYIVATAEAGSNLARYDGVHYGHRTSRETDMVDMYSLSRAEGFGDEVKRRVMLGTYVLSSGYYDAYYLKASRVRALIKQDFGQAFQKVDAVICPTSPTTAFKLGERTTDLLAMYLCDVYTSSTNLAGIPGISIPCGLDSRGLPVGLQILAPPLEEEKLLRIAGAFQQETEFHMSRPPLDKE